MSILLKNMRNTAISLCLVLGTGQALADTHDEDTKVQADMTSFTEENVKLRENHIQEMRVIHLKHINELYDRKLAHSKELSSLWLQFKPGDKEGNRSLRSQVKKKQEEFKDAEEKFRDNFKENVLKVRNKDFRESMKKRQKEMKGRFRN